jgi:hypothetical protein
MRATALFARRAPCSARSANTKARTEASNAREASLSAMSADFFARLAAASALCVAASITALSGAQDASITSASAAAWRGFIRSVYQNASARNSNQRAAVCLLALSGEDEGEGSFTASCAIQDSGTQLNVKPNAGFHTSFGRGDPCTQG